MHMSAAGGEVKRGLPLLILLVHVSDFFCYSLHHFSPSLLASAVERRVALLISYVSLQKKRSKKGEGREGGEGGEGGERGRERGGSGRRERGEKVLPVPCFSTTAQ